MAYGCLVDGEMYLLHTGGQNQIYPCPLWAMYFLSLQQTQVFCISENTSLYVIEYRIVSAYLFLISPLLCSRCLTHCISVLVL